jgi:hypothetical protein
LPHSPIANFTWRRVKRLFGTAIYFLAVGNRQRILEMYQRHPYVDLLLTRRLPCAT